MRWYCSDILNKYFKFLHLNKIRLFKIELFNYECILYSFYCLKRYVNIPNASALQNLYGMYCIDPLLYLPPLKHNQKKPCPHPLSRRPRWPANQNQRWQCMPAVKLTFAIFYQSPLYKIYTGDFAAIPIFYLKSI